MEFATLDPGKLLALMVFGGLFALVGLWLILRPKPEGSAARIEMLGMKVESSSAGLVVFLIGAAFLALPVIVPEARIERPREASTSQNTPDGGSVEADGSTGSAAPTRESEAPLALVLPASATTSEIEPNDRISASNQIALGQTVAGQLPPDDEDWYVIPSGESEKLRVTFRNLGGGCPQYQLFDEMENRVRGQQICSYERSHSSEQWVESARYYLRVLAGSSRTEYEVFVGGS